MISITGMCGQGYMEVHNINCPPLRVRTGWETPISHNVKNHLPKTVFKLYSGALGPLSCCRRGILSCSVRLLPTGSATNGVLMGVSAATMFKWGVYLKDFTLSGRLPKDSPQNNALSRKWSVLTSSPVSGFNVGPICGWLVQLACSKNVIVSEIYWIAVCTNKGDKGNACSNGDMTVAK